MEESVKDLKNESVKMGCVSLVGAGCGGREWITLEGLGLLRECDAVVYDDLIDQDLLKEAPSHAEKIYAGKRSHKPSAGQEDIERLLLKLAGQNKHVVRLKGGDPFVFGRGGEEIRFCNQHHIPWRVVPGISSALAIPEEAGIPVTYRGISRSVHIMTAHTREDVLRRDMEQFAGLEGTLIFLMGLESLPEIVAVLKEKGRDGTVPAAVLSGGNAANPYKITGTLDTILEKAREAEITPPGVIVVGDVVGLDLYQGIRFPLEGIKVGLTGTDDFQQKLRRRLAPLGAETVSLMSGQCMEQEDTVIPWEEVTAPHKKWVVFTSVQGVRCFFERCRKENIDYRRLAFCDFAVIGSATGNQLAEYGFRADLCPQEYTSQALAEELLRQAGKEEKIYLFCSRQGSDLLPQRLMESGRSCERFHIYDTRFSCPLKQTDKLKYILFGSAGGVRALQQSGYRMDENMQGICIGEVSAQAFRECFGKEPFLAKEAAAEAMAEILLSAADTPN